MAHRIRYAMQDEKAGGKIRPSIDILMTVWRSPEGGHKFPPVIEEQETLNQDECRYFLHHGRKVGQAVSRSAIIG
jgi:hypothetical protein